MSSSPPFRSPSSGSSSMVSSRMSMFEDAPESPNSWKFDHSLVESPRAKTPIKPPLGMRLRACSSPTTAAPQTPLKIVGMPSKAEKTTPRHLPVLPAIPSAEKIDTESQKTAAKWSQESPFLQRKPVHRTQSLSRASTVQSDPRLERLDSIHRSMSAFRSQTRDSPRLVSSAPAAVAGPHVKKSKLKVKITCPGEDEILSMKVSKENVRSVQALLEVVSIKLNVRYFMRPDDLEFNMRFSDGSLQPVALRTDDVGRILEDFIMEYVHTKSKIYLEARYKAPAGRDRAPSMCETVTDELVC